MSDRDIIQRPLGLILHLGCISDSTDTLLSQNITTLDLVIVGRSFVFERNRSINCKWGYFRRDF